MGGRGARQWAEGGAGAARRCLDAPLAGDTVSFFAAAGYGQLPPPQPWPPPATPAQMPAHALAPLPLLLLLLLAAPAPTHSLPAGTLLYALPQALDMANASLVRADPGPGAASGTTVIDLWRLGAGPLRQAAWPLAPYTGAPAAPAALTRGLQPAAPGTSAVSFSSGVFGAVLNTSAAAPIEPGQSLGTVTVEQSWAAGAAAAPWAAGGGLELSAMYQVPTASRAPGAIAVYSSWTLGLRSLAPADAGAFVWYETALFDLHRPLGGDEVWRDTISGSVILHGVLGAPSAFHTAAPDSCAASSEPWAGFRRVHFSVGAAQVRAAIAAANAKFNLTLADDPAGWALVHWNIELEGTAGVAAGHSLHSLTITAQ